MNEANPALPSPPEAARVLAEIGVLLELNSADRFRGRAFAAAARALEGTDRDLTELARAGKLDTLPGVGAGIAGILGELLLTGRSRLHEELVAQTPVGLFDLMRLPGLGTKRIRTLHERLGVDSLAYLSVDGMMKAVNTANPDRTGFCNACFTANYPVPVEMGVTKEENEW